MKYERTRAFRKKVLQDQIRNRFVNELKAADNPDDVVFENLGEIYGFASELGLKDEDVIDAVYGAFDEVKAAYGLDYYSTDLL